MLTGTYLAMPEHWTFCTYEKLPPDEAFDCDEPQIVPHLKKYFPLLRLIEDLWSVIDDEVTAANVGQNYMT